MSIKSEWCYNYHDPEKPYAFNAKNYPTLDEQRRFLKAYIQHHPFPTTPTMSPAAGPSSSISSFFLDSRVPPAQILEEESRRNEALDKNIQQLMHEIRIWRIALSAQWVAWGIVQATVPGMGSAEQQEFSSPPVDGEAKIDDTTNAQVAVPASDDVDPDLANDATHKRPEGLVAESLTKGEDPPLEKEDDGEEFDYLSYAQERAMFFWGDVLQLGILEKESLPAELLDKVKFVDH